MVWLCPLSESPGRASCPGQRPPPHTEQAPVPSSPRFNLPPSPLGAPALRADPHPPCWLQALPTSQQKSPGDDGVTRLARKSAAGTEDSSPHASSTTQATRRLKDISEPCLWTHVRLGLQGGPSHQATSDTCPWARGPHSASAPGHPRSRSSCTPSPPPLLPASQERAQTSRLLGRPL